FSFLRWFDHAPNRTHDGVEPLDLCLQLLPPFARQLVVACSAVVLCDPPLGLDPTLDQHSLQGGIQRAFLHSQDLFRRLLDIERNAVAVHRSESGERLQDQHIERAGGNVSAHTHSDTTLDRLWLSTGHRTIGSNVELLRRLDVTNHGRVSRPTVTFRHPRLRCPMPSAPPESETKRDDVL